MADILDKKGREMLSEFGKGKGMTGSGAAIVLSAMSGAQLLISVCKLTCSKERYTDVHDEIADIQQILQTHYLPELEKMMVLDMEAVAEMLKYRIQRDKETDKVKKEEYDKQAKALLENATNTMMDFCRLCLDIIPMALQVYRIGLKSAQGDSGVALNSLLSCAGSGLFTALINIQNAKAASWTNSKRSEVETFFGRLHEYQYIVNGKLARMYNSTK